MKKRLFAALIATVMLVALLPVGVFAAAGTPDDPIVVVPENVLNVQIVNEDGEPVDGIDVDLRDPDGTLIANWKTGTSGVYCPPYSEAKEAGKYEVPGEVFQSLVSPYELKGVGGHHYDFDFYFEEGQTRTLNLEYIGERENTLTVPANTMLLNVDANYAGRLNTHSFEANGTDYTFNDHTGRTEFPLAAGSYEGMIHTRDNQDGGGGSTDDLIVRDQPAEYIPVTYKLSSLLDSLRDDGTAVSGGRVYSLREDTPERSAVFAIISGSVVNAPVPDENGYVTFYIDNSTREFSAEISYSWNDAVSSGGGGGSSHTHYAYDSVDFTFKAMDFPDEGATLMHVPAGNYTIDLDNVPAEYKSEVTNITVAQSTDVQTVTITLAPDHTHAATATAQVPATCEKDGNIAYWFCDGCGKYFSDEACTKEITKEQTVDKATGHDYTWLPVKAATCTEMGTEEGICKNCDDSVTRDIAALGHKLVQHEAKAPTCTEKGWDAYETCDRCDHTTYKEKAALGHKYGQWNPAEDGKNHEKACACGDTVTEAHAWDKGVVTKKPTHEAEGVKTFTCSVCGATRTESIPKVIDSPDTGDSSLMLLWLGLVLLSGSAIAGITLYGKKRNVR